MTPNPRYPILREMLAPILSVNDDIAYTMKIYRDGRAYNTVYGKEMLRKQNLILKIYRRTQTGFRLLDRKVFSQDFPQSIHDRPDLDFRIFVVADWIQAWQQRLAASVGH